MIRVDVNPKCVHFGLGLESYGLGLGLVTAGLDYIPESYFCMRVDWPLGCLDRSWWAGVKFRNLGRW